MLCVSRRAWNGPKDGFEKGFGFVGERVGLGCWTSGQGCGGCCCECVPVFTGWVVKIYVASSVPVTCTLPWREQVGKHGGVMK